MALYNAIRFARDDAADWAAANPVLGEGEPAFEKDTRRLKIGDGYSPWQELEYFGTPVPGSGGATDEMLQAHINSMTPHPAYDDGPSFLLLYQNAKV